MSSESSVSSPSRVPVGVDATRPSIARIYDGFLGGKTNYAVDRAVMDKVSAAVPEAIDIAKGNRRFLNRACRLLSSQTGITQYLDCGSGLPTAENTHEVVQRANPDASVVYVDNDPVVLAHGRALLEDNDLVHMVEADIFDAAQVLENPVVQRHIDFSEPVVLLQVATMHHLEGDAPDLMKQYIDALAPGSYVVLSHFLDPETPELTPVAKRIEDVLVNGSMGAGRFRTRAEIEAMGPGLDFLPPNQQTKTGGLSVCDEWWPDGPRISELSSAAQCVGGWVGKKL
jgi:SAM-dependent methyltransferase